MTPTTRRIAVRVAQQELQWRPWRRPHRQAVPRVSRQRTAAPRCGPTARELTCLPRGELQRACDQDDHADSDRYGIRQRRLLHLYGRERDAHRIGDHSEHGPHEEVPHTHQRGQWTEASLARVTTACRYRHSIGTKHGSIIATIITTHIPMKEAPAAGQVCPGIRIHIIDIVHPPGIDISPIADIDAHQTIVPAALAAKTNAETPRKAYWEARSESMRRELSPIPVASTTVIPWLSPNWKARFSARGSQVVRMPRLQARPLGGRTSIGTDKFACP